MAVELDKIVSDFAFCIQTVDSRSPVAFNARSKQPYQPGLGPHPETQTVALVTDEMKQRFPEQYKDALEIGLPYPDLPRQKCDICIGSTEKWDWAIEVKMLRILGDNGKPNDNILMHILSPYPSHRSAVTDCGKLASSPIGERNAILIYGYEAEDYPLKIAINAFETIARAYVNLGNKYETQFDNLVHPVHSSGAVYAWEIWPI